MKAVTKSIFLFCLILVAFAANSYAQQWTEANKKMFGQVLKNTGQLPLPAMLPGSCRISMTVMKDGIFILRFQ